MKLTKKKTQRSYRKRFHYSDVIMGMMASQTASLTIVYSTVYSGADQRKHQSFASLAFVRGIYRWPVNSPHKWPVTRKMLSSCRALMSPCQYKGLTIFCIELVIIEWYGNYANSPFHLKKKWDSINRYTSLVHLVNSVCNSHLYHSYNVVDELAEL